MPIRMTGLNSGMDTESIITELMKAYRTKSDNIEKKQTKLGWTQEAWKDLNKKVYGFYTNISNLKYSSAYSLKKSTVSDQTKATVTASGNAVTGVQKLNVISTAQTGYLTGAKLDSTVTKVGRARTVRAPVAGFVTLHKRRRALALLTHLHDESVIGQSAHSAQHTQGLTHSKLFCVGDSSIIFFQNLHDVIVLMTSGEITLLFDDDGEHLIDRSLVHYLNPP